MKVHPKILLKLLFPAFFALAFTGCSDDSEKTEKAEIDSLALPLPKLIPYVDHGRWGYADSTGKIIVPCAYDYVSELYHGYGRLQNNDHYALIDSTGKIRTGFAYRYMGINHDGLIEVSNDEHEEGVIDVTGKEVVPCRYDDVLPYKSIVCVLIGSKVGMYDAKGTRVLAEEYEEIYPSYGTNLVRVKKNGRYGCANFKGEMVIPAKYEYLGNPPWNGEGKIDLTGVIELFGGKRQNRFNEMSVTLGYGGMVLFRRDHQLGLLDTMGKELVQPLYTEIETYPEGYAIVSYRGKTGIVNNKGVFLLPFGFDEVNQFSDGMTCGKKDGKWKLYDSLGVEQNVALEDEVIFHRGKAIVPSNGKEGVIDKRGNFVIPAEYDRITNEWDSYFIAEKGTTYTIFDFDAKKRFSFSDAEPETLFDGPNALVFHRNGKYGIFNLDGKEVLPAVYDSIYSDNELYVIGRRPLSGNGMKWGAADENGKLLLEAQYDEIDVTATMFFAVKSDTLALFDHRGKQRSGFIYRHEDMRLSYGENGIQRLMRDGELFYVDFRGREYRAKDDVQMPD